MSSRRTEIVTIARGIFAARGYKSTSMRDIADACDLLAGSLYSHFRGKSEILELILGPFYDRLIPEQEAAAALQASGLVRMETMIRRVLPVLAGHVDELTIIHYDWNDLLGIPELAEIRERSNYALELWSRVIVEGRADGSLRRDVDPEVTVRVITSALHGVLDHKRYGARPNPLTEDGLEQLVEIVVALLGASVRAAPADAPAPGGAARSRSPEQGRGARPPSPRRRAPN